MRSRPNGAGPSPDAATDTLGVRYYRQRRAVIASALGFAVCITAAACLLIWQWQIRTLAAAQHEERNLSIALSELTARSLDSVDILLRSVVETVGDGDLSDPDFARHLHDVMRERAVGVPPVRGLIVRDATGRMVAFSRGYPPPDIPVDDRDYFAALRDHATENLFVGAPRLTRVSKEWAINVARRLSRPDGTFAGVAVATVEPLYYEQVYAAVNLDPGGAIAVLRDDGVLLARHPHAVEMMGKPIGDTEFRRRLGRSTEPVVARVVSGIDGAARIVAGQFDAKFPVYVAVSQREDFVLATWRRDAAYLLAGTSLVLLALGLMTRRMFQQIMRREAAERETLKAKLHAKVANEAKTRFLAHMSHELRTPLNAILGFSEMIRNQLHGPDAAARGSEYASDIYASGRHLLDLINDVLDMSQIEAGRYQLDLEPVNFADTVATCLPMTEYRAREKGVVISNEVDAGLTPVQADARAVKQVLLNLLSNAVKFSPPGAQITVRAQVLRSGKTEIRVADTGVGIPAEALAHIFEPFARGDHMRAQRDEGIGLGLSISQHLMKLHGGSLHIESVIGAGTTVTMRFPAERGRTDHLGIVTDMLSPAFM